MKMTPASALSRQVQTQPKSTAFVFHEDVWTYERLAVAAESFARGLAARGVDLSDVFARARGQQQAVSAFANEQSGPLLRKILPSSIRETNRSLQEA